MNIRCAGIEQVLKDVLDIVKTKADSEKVAIVENYEVLPDVMLDVELMKTCVFNIVTNAFHAMSEGGTLTVRTTTENGSLRLDISDTGTGISKENVEKIFEPFFTTKADGLGLGLAITKRIIEEHGGSVEFSSVENQGSDFIIRLPLINR